MAGGHEVCGLSLRELVGMDGSERQPLPALGVLQGAAMCVGGLPWSMQFQHPSPSLRQGPPAAGCAVQRHL